MPEARSYDGQPINYSVAGHGEPYVVLVHGWCCNRSFWRSQIKHMAGECTVVALDLAGHGRSGASRKRWTIKSFANDVTAVVAQLGFPPVVLVGHSMGGAVALDAALALSSCALGVIGVDTLIYSSYSRWDRSRIRKEIAPFEADFRGTVTEVVRDMFAPGADPACVDWVTRIMASASPQVAVPALKSLFAWDLRPSLEHLAIPVAIVCSELLAAEVDLTFFEGLFEVTLLPNTGHFPMLEVPAALNDALVNDTRRFAARASLSQVRPA